jgi:hypothetical protein
MTGDELDARDARDWLVRARRGDLAGAWAMSDRIRGRSGPSQEQRTPRHLQRVWDGTPFEGRHVLVRCYHGLGDTLQFIRYIPLVAARAREVSVWVQPTLAELVATVDGVTRVLPLHDGVPELDYDVDVEVMELPYVFRSTLETLPDVVPYVHAPALEPTEARPRIGLVWRAGGWDPARSIPFPELSPLLALDGITWCSLQHEPAVDVDPRLRLFDVESLTRTGSLMRAMDLVITVDSVTAHLAGALAVPVWTLLPQPADWRWLEGRADSPWYPTMRLFRQPRPGDWRSVVTAACASLRG